MHACTIICERFFVILGISGCDSLRLETRNFCYDVLDVYNKPVHVSSDTCRRRKKKKNKILLPLSDSWWKIFVNACVCMQFLCAARKILYTS